MHMFCHLFWCDAIAGVFYNEDIEDLTSPTLDGPLQELISQLPGYEDILKLFGFPLYLDYEG